MPLDGGGDKRGWSLRGRVVYRFLGEDGQALSYVVLAKYHFPKAFARRLELYGQAGQPDERPEYREFLARHGLILVEGFNDVLALDHLGVCAQAIYGSQAADQRVVKIIERGKRAADGRVSLLFDCDNAGDAGAKEAA